MTTPLIQLDAARCTRCRACVRVCPVSTVNGFTGLTEMPDALCLRCGQCVAACPVQAVAHADLPPGAAQPLGATPEADALRHLLQHRRSVRNFTARPIEHTQWQALLAMMAHTPSGTNARPMRATVVTDPERLAALTRETVAMFAELLKMLASPLGRLALRVALGGGALALLQKNASAIAALVDAGRKGGDPILYRAPGALILRADRLAVCGHDDCVLAAMTAMLHAPTLGLATCMIGFLLPAFQRRPALRTVIDLPRDHDVHAVLAVGYPAVRYHSAPPRPAIPVTWR